jgi:ankyrin repeat protein
LVCSFWEIMGRSTFEQTWPKRTRRAYCGRLMMTICDAASSGDLEKVKALLKDDPGLVFHNANSWGETPLHVAASNGHRGVAEVLLANGADVNARDNSGRTPLHPSAWNGHKAVAELLLANGADVNARDKSGGTPLHQYTREKISDGATEAACRDVAALLLAHGADVNATDSNGDTPLHMATGYRRRKDLMELLLAAGARVNVEGYEGRTPLLIAVNHGWGDKVQILLSSHASLPHNFRGPEALRGIVSLLSERDGPECAKARVAELLRPLVDPLIAELDSDDKMVRHYATEMLTMTGEVRVIGPLVKRLGHEDGTLSGQYYDKAARALAVLGGPEVVKAVAPKINDTNDKIRYNSAYVLGRVGNTEAISVLCPALNDAQADVRICVAESLAELARKGAALDDPPTVVASALRNYQRAETQREKIAMAGLLQTVAPRYLERLETDVLLLIASLRDADIFVDRTWDHLEKPEQHPIRFAELRVAAQTELVRRPQPRAQVSLSTPPPRPRRPWWKIFS